MPLARTTRGGTPARMNFDDGSHRRLLVEVRSSCGVTRAPCTKSYRWGQSPSTLLPTARSAAALLDRPCQVANPSFTRLKMVRRF